MKNRIYSFCLIALITGCSSPQTDLNSQVSTDSSAALIEHGRYLVTIAGCNDCHSPKIMSAQGPIPDPSRLLSGHPSDAILPTSDSSTAKHWLLFYLDGTAARGPWGTSFASNITSDPSGIGNWSEEQFANAIRKGWSKGQAGARSLLPPMPWPNYAAMTDEDIRAIFAYLKSIPPVKNVSPSPIPPGAN